MLLKVDLTPAIKVAQHKKAQRIALQIPEGLKSQTQAIVGELEEKTNATVFVLSDPCWGACDVGDEKAQNLGADLLVHLGHSKMLESTMEVVYIPVQAEWLTERMEKGLKELETRLNEADVKRVGLTASVQYLPYIEKVQKELEKKGFQCRIGNTTPRVTHAGQVLGCNYSTSISIRGAVDGFVYLGEGLFHPIGITFASNKPVWTMSPDGEVIPLAGEKEKLLRRRYAAIAAAMEAQTFGIILSSKRGQLKKEKAMAIKEMIESAGKKAVLLVTDEVRPEQLLGPKIDCYVMTACPRIAVEEYSRFNRPVLNPVEAEMVLGKRSMDTYALEEWSY